MPVTPLPTAPSRSDDGTTFAANADAFIGALPAFATEVNAVIGNINDVISSSETIATALQSSGVDMWQSSTVYAYGDLVWSPLDYYVYRSISADPGLNLDPSDPAAVTYWRMVSVTGAVDLTSAQTLSNKTLHKTKQVLLNKSIRTGTDQLLSFSLYSEFDLTLTANSVLTFSSLPSAIDAIVQEVDIIIRRTGGTSYTVTWPVDVVWLTTGLTPPATAQIEHYKIRYSSATGELLGRLIGYKP